MQKLSIILFILAVSLLFNACNTSAEKSKVKSGAFFANKKDSISVLFIEKCMVCHETKEKTAKTMLAPPFYQIKKRYQQASINKEDFVEIMSEWVKNPKPDNVLIPDAVTHFGIMPKLNYSEIEVLQICRFIYDKNLPKPRWFDAHEALHKKETERNIKCE